MSKGVDQQGVVQKVRSFLGAVFGDRGRGPDLSNRKRLPFHLYLSMGVTSFQLFPAGPIDEFRFFQRVGVPGDHELEFISRLEVGAEGTEDFQPYGLFKLRRAQALPIYDDEEVMDLWRTLNQEYGLKRVPSAKSMTKGFSGFDLRDGDGSAGEGENELDAPRAAKVAAKRGRKRLTYREVLEVLREQMSDAVKIAWIEDAFQESPARGQIVHRYYLDSRRRAFLVRHHWARGKQLFAAETSAEAMQICLQSGLYARPKAA